MTNHDANSGGVRGVSIRYDFDCFDRLPATIRRALANADSKYCSVQLYAIWQGGSMTDAEIVKEIEKLNARSRRALR
jgi:hypothetical protein